MVQEIIIVSEVSQTEKDKYHTIPLMRGTKKKNDTDKLIYKTEVEYRGRKQNYGYQGMEREG